MNTFDLQVHTTASDGTHSPTECVHMARANKLSAIAVTDHDTVGGIDEAIRAGGDNGVRVIPGIEISAEEHGIHVLGFGINHTDPRLITELKKFEESREEGARKMVENFKREGFAIDWEDVRAEATGSVVGRPHIARAIFKRPENKEKLKSTPTMDEFFARYLVESSPTYVSRAQISARDAISLIHQSGGVAVWSHPPIPDFVGDCDGLEMFLRDLIAWELDGIEVFNPAHTEDDVACLEKLATRYGLLASAGSDFHTKEPYTRAGEPRAVKSIGEFPTYGRSADGILPALDGAMARHARVADRG